MIDFGKFIDIYYWISSRPSEFHWFVPVMVVFSLLIIFGVIVNVFVKKKIGDKLMLKFLKSIPKTCYIFGFVGIVLAYLRYEQVRFLSMRLWFLLLFLFFIGWVIFYIYQFKVLYPKVDCEYRTMRFEDQYRPKKGEKKKKKKKARK